MVDWGKKFPPQDSLGNTGVGKLFHLRGPLRFKLPKSREKGEVGVKSQEEHGMNFERPSEVFNGGRCQEML